MSLLIFLRDILGVWAYIAIETDCFINSGCFGVPFYFHRHYACSLLHNATIPLNLDFQHLGSLYLTRRIAAVADFACGCYSLARLRFMTR
jgi:hypothetical protein